VVIPTRDTADMVLQCLDAVFDHDGALDLEVIVVDDGSRDGTAARIQAAVPRVRVLRHEHPKGFTAAANKGLDETTRPVLLLLNSDTQVVSGALKVVADVFARCPELGIAGAQLLQADGRPQWSRGESLPGLLWLFAQSSGLGAALGRYRAYRRFRPLDTAIDRDVAWVPGTALAMRREVWEQVGPLDETLHFYAQDLDLCARTRNAGWAVRLLADFKVRHHQGATVQAVLGAAGRQHHALLWSDLIRWASKHRGRPFGRRAGMAVTAGARLRLIGRRMWTPAIPRKRRDVWSRENEEIQNGLNAIRTLSRSDRLR
jgi:GT2 family glycosyltransferase